MTATILYTRMDSPIGELVLTSNGDALTQVIMQSERHGSRLAGHIDTWRHDDKKLAQAHKQLAAYFAGELREFDLVLAAEGTAFQHRVWAALREIAYGATASYGEIARRIGQPSASRAVGLANGSNPIPIIVPCHRVIGANGSMTGFGGGIPRKRWLLAHEAQHAPRERTNRNETAHLFSAVS